MNNNDKKKCSFCKQILDFNNFIKDITQPDGYHQKCRTCETVVKKLKKSILTMTPEEKTVLLLKLYLTFELRPTQLYRLFNCKVEYIYQVLKDYDVRRCEGNDGCGLLKSWKDFYEWSYSEDGYMRVCKDCAKPRAAKSSQLYYTNHREYKQKQNHKWRNENLEYHRFLILEHYYNNKSMYLHAFRKRQLLKKHAVPPWVNLDKIKSIYEEARRLTLETGVPHEVDHIIPLQHDCVCGLHVETNLQILTRDENRQKSNKF